MAPNAAEPSLCGLPTELRDVICDLVAESETRLVLRIEIEQDTITQQKYPRISAFVVAGLSSACRQLRREFSAALERHIEVIMTTGNGSDCPHLMETSNLRFHAFRKMGFVARDTRIYISATPHTSVERERVQKVHALATFVPIELPSNTIDAKLWRLRMYGEALTDLRELVVLLVTDGSKALPSRRSLIVPQLPPSEFNASAQKPSQETVTALEKVKQAVKGTKWGTNMWYYTLWFDYVVRFSPKVAAK